MSLHPLVLMLEFARAVRAEDPFAFQRVSQDYLLRTAGGGFERARFEWDESLLEMLDAVRRPGCDPTVRQRLGEKLGAFVRPLGWNEIAAQIREATGAGRRVLLSIRSAASELYGLPWELLTLPESGQHLGELPDVLLRYEWPETETSAEQPLPRSGGGRVLLAWSAAGGGLPLSQHEQALRLACQNGQHPFDPARDLLPNASLAKIGDALAAAAREGRPIAVLQILCHGGQIGTGFGLLLDAEPGSPGSGRVDASRLRQVLAPHLNMVRLVVLTACDSGNTGRPGSELGSVAQVLHRSGAASVLASRYPLSVQGSVRLVRVLYSQLLVELASLEEAVLAARAELGKDAALLDWSSLQLYARAADGSDTRPVVFRPYPGLSPFGSEERRFYFGRESLSEKLWSRTQELFATPGAARLLAVLGPSGSGKSSVARAGLIAELQRRPLSRPGVTDAPTRFAIFKPGEHPLRALADALAALPQGPAGAPVLVLADQIEEVYTLCADPAERDAFVRLLLRGALDANLPVFIVVTLRSDFLGETQRQHPELNRLLAEQSKIVTAMTPEELRRAIAQPAARLGRPFDETTIELLLREAGSHEGALPLLGFALSQLWEGVLAGKTSEATLREVGGVGGALAGRAQAIYRALSPAEQATARRALLRLVRLGEGVRDTRRRVPIKDLRGRDETEAVVLGVLRRFANEHARLITLSRSGDEIEAEVTHEALFESWSDLRQWIDQSRVDRRFHDRVTEAARLWEQDARQPGRLWRSPDLDLLRSYAKRLPEEISPLQQDFLTAADRHQRREKQWRRGAVAAVCATFIAAGGIYITKERQVSREAHERQHQAQLRAKEAEDRKLEADRRLLESFIERGRQFLVEKDSPSAALPWLARAMPLRKDHPIVDVLLHDAMRSFDATHAVLVGHGAAIYSAIYSPDGRRIVTVSEDHTARIWDAETGRSLSELKGHAGEVWSMAYSPDGRRILTGSEDATARIWDAETGRSLIEIKGSAGGIRATAFSRDGRRILTGSKDGTIRAWDAETGLPLIEYKGSEGAILSLSYSADGSRVLSGGSESISRIWDAETGRRLHELKAFDGSSFLARYSPDGGSIVTASGDGKAAIWDAASGKLRALLQEHTDSIVSATFSPDGRLLLTASLDQTARIWDVQFGQERFALQDRGQIVHDAAFSADGSRIVTGNADGKVRTFDAKTGWQLAQLAGHIGPVHRVGFSADGRRILSAGQDGTARIWRAAASHALYVAGKGVEAGSNYATLSPDGRILVALAARGKLQIVDVETGSTKLEATAVRPRPRLASISPDGRRIVATGLGWSAQLVDAASGQSIAELKGHSASIIAAQFSPDGRRIVTASEDHTARIWDAESGRELFVLQGHSGNIVSARFSPNGKRIVTASEDHTARIWDVNSGQLHRALAGHNDVILDARFSPDGKHIVTASRDRGARIWDAETGEPTPHILRHLRAILRASYSPDGLHILTASDDATARIWEAETGHLRAELSGHGEGLTSAEYSADGLRIVTASAEGTVRIWEAKTGLTLSVILCGVADKVRSAELSQNGRRLLTTSAQGQPRVWDVAPELRTDAEILRQIRCKVGLRFEREGSDVLVQVPPDPKACAGEPGAP